jgi:NAD(P)-dependent dehydrogenase (short-subunit alcohol dehydrogenase family)
MTRPFAGLTAVVTGGASGIGRGCAERLSKDGAHVVVLDRDAKSAARVAAEIGGSWHLVDIASREECAAAADVIARDTGHGALLVNAAGILQPHLPAPQDVSMIAFGEMVDVNLKGTFNACAIFGAAMARRGHGAIVNIASISGMRSTPLHAYGPIKAAIISLTGNLAAAWGRQGVRVNAVSPGAVLTPAMQASVDSGHRNLAAMQAATATGHIVTVADVAATVAFLLSDEAKAITGVNLPIDAGWLVADPWTMFGGLPPIRPE